MDKIDKRINEFAQFISDMFGGDVKILAIDDAIKIADKVRAKAFKDMIVDAKKALDEINDDPDMDVQDKIKSLSTIMSNASIVDIDDMNMLTQEEAESYCNIVKAARSAFNDIMGVIVNDIHRLKNEIAQSKEDEDLTKLSKEELIERLRRK